MAIMQPMMNQGTGLQSLAQLPSQYPPQYQMGEKKYGVGKRIGRGIKHFFGGRSEKFEQVPTVTPEVMYALQQILSGGLQNLQNPYEGFGPIEDLAREKFHSQTVPSISERFTSLGGAGTQQRNSGFEGALGSAAAGLESQLAALRSQYGFQNKNQSLQQLQLGMHPQFENIHREAQPGFIEQAYKNGLEGLKATAKAYGGSFGG